MASAVKPPTKSFKAAHMLNLPAEIKYQIQSYFVPSNNKIELNFCSVPKYYDTDADYSSGDGKQRRPSPLLQYLHNQAEIVALTRRLGLHLLVVNPMLAEEMTALYSTAGTVVEAHCATCLERVLSHLVEDLRLDFEQQVLPVMRYLHIPISRESRVFPPDLKGLARTFNRVLGKYYGGFQIQPSRWLDLSSVAHVQKWTLEKRTQYKLDEKGMLVLRNGNSSNVGSNDAAYDRVSDVPSSSSSSSSSMCGMQNGCQTTSTNIRLDAEVNVDWWVKLGKVRSRKYIVESEEWWLVADLDSKQP